MSDQPNTGGRSVLLMLTLAGAAALVVAGGGYALWTWYAAPPPAQSSVNLNRVTGATQTGSQEQQAYRELLRENNERGAQSATASNSSFIASIPQQQDVIRPADTPPTRPPATKPAPATPRQAGSRTPEQEKALNEARQKALGMLLARMQTPAPEAELPAAQQLGGKESGWEAWRDSLKGSDVQQAAARSRQDVLSSQPPLEVVAPYWRGPGEICTGIDSDNGATPVLGCIKTGKYAGAVLKSTEGAKLSGNGVIVHFTTMTLNGQAYKVDAYALDDKKLVANIATDVDSHYVRRVALPAIFGGLGKGGNLYEQANTQVLNNGYSTVTARPGLPDPTALGGVILGGAASTAAEVLTSDAARLPDRTVTVDNGQVVAIQFMRGVYSTDAESAQGAATSVSAQPASSASLSSNPTPSAAELRADTQARIRAAEQKGNARE